MSETEAVGALRIGECLLLAQSHELHAPGREPQRLPKRLVQLLQVLAEQPGQVWTRQQLLDTIWQRRMVADEVLSRAIADLRLALGDDARSPRYIETIPKTGYRLLATVQTLAADPSTEPSPLTPDPPEPPAATSPEPSAAPEPPVPAAAPTASNRRQHLLQVAGLLVLLGAISGGLWHARRDAPAPAAHSIAQQVARAAPLTSDAAWEMHPATSADGVWLAYARSAPFGSQRQIHIRHLLSGEDRVWADQPGVNDSPAFSPDGSELVYRHCPDAGGHCQWRRRSVHGGAGQLLGAAHPLAAGADWSEWGIVAVLADAGAAASATLAWLPAAAGQDWVLLGALDAPTTDAAAIPDQLPRWIPGTRAVAVLRGGGLLPALHRVELDAPQHSIALPLPASRVQDHRWRSADEAWLSSDHSGFRALLRWRPGAAPELLGARGTRGLALLPRDGAVLDIAEYDNNLHQLSLSEPGLPATLIEVSTRSEGQPALSADGRWLALVSLREGSDQIWLKDLRNGELRRVSPALPGTQAVRPAFSADSKHLYFSVYSEQGVHAWAFDLQRQTTRVMTELGDAAFAPQPGHNPGEFVLARHLQAGMLQLWHHAGHGAAAQPIADAGQVLEFRFDHGVLWWRSAQSAEWQTLTLSSGQRSNLAGPDTTGRITPWSWTVSENALYAIYSDGVLYRHDGAEPSTWVALGSVAEGSAAQSMAVHAASDRLILTRVDRIAVDLYRVPASD